MKKNGPWTIKESKIVYKNPWLEVREDQVIRPDGTDGVFAVATKEPGVSVLAIDDEKYVYLLDEFRYALEKVSIETISGGVDGSEDRIVAAKRELQEEAGIIAEEWKDFGRVDPLSSNVLSPQYLFLARKLRFVEASRDGNESIEVHKMHFDEAFEMVMDGRITYAPTCILIMKTKIFLDSHSV